MDRVVYYAQTSKRVFETTTVRGRFFHNVATHDSRIDHVTSACRDDKILDVSKLRAFGG